MRTGTRLLRWLAGGLLAHALAAGAASGDYATDLATVYGGYQRMLALKEACDAAQPATRAANDKAFVAWRARHDALVRDLQRRVTAMIRLASRDEKEYARNLGKYEGAIVQERQEYRQVLLGLDAADLRQQCERMPALLADAGADFSQVYAAELEVIRKRK